MKKKLLFSLTCLVIISAFTITIFLVAHATPAPSPTPMPTWWNSGWLYRAPVVISNFGSALTDYQVKVVVPLNAQHMQSSYGDVRFVDRATGNECSYWLDTDPIDAAAGTQTFWVKVPFIPASGTATIYMYYGNKGVSTTSNIHNTFIWGDDFSNQTWTDNNLNQWQGSGGNPTQGVSGGAYYMIGTYAPDVDGTNSSAPIAEIKIPGSTDSTPDQPTNLLPFTGNYIAEADVESLATAPIQGYPSENQTTVRPTGGAYICARYANVSNKYEQVLGLTWSTTSLNKVVGDAWTSLGSQWVGSEAQGSTWYKLTAVVLRENQLGVSVNDQSVIPLTADSSLPYTGLAFLGYDAGHAFNIGFDNFRVREYASPEPIVSIGSEATYTPTPTATLIPNSTPALPAGGGGGGSGSGGSSIASTTTVTPNITLTPMPAPTLGPAPTPAPEQTPGITPGPTPGPTPVQPKFSLSNLAISPTSPTTGGNVTISVNVLNTGEIEGNYSAILKVDGSIEQIEDITLAGGGNTTISFTTSKDIAGKYQVEIGDLSDEFTISSPVARVSWFLILDIIAAVIIIGGISAYLLKRRKVSPST
jgi:hypothetical protein